MPYKSKLFRRNNGGRKLVSTSRNHGMSGGFRAANPKPKVSDRSTQRLENKSITVATAVSAVNTAGNVFHMDTIGQGTLASQRTGQKHQVTGVHIRGRIPMDNDASYDEVGYYLVWDRQPSEIKPGFPDIFQTGVGVNSINAFPNNSNSERFIIISRKTRSMTNALVAGNQYNATMQWSIDDYYQFSRKYIATSITGGGSTISDRSSGALYLVTVGGNTGGGATSMNFDYRLYFNDV